MQLISFIAFAMTVFFICLSENVTCVHVGKSEDHFFSWSFIKMVDKKFFGKNGCILRKFTGKFKIYKGRLSFF